MASTGVLFLTVLLLSSSNLATAQSTLLLELQKRYQSIFQSYAMCMAARSLLAHDLTGSNVLPDSIAGIDSVVRGEATATSGSINQLKKSVADAVTNAVADSCTGDITAVGQALAVAVANASATADVGLGQECV
jgi:hypothetical protein